jgi:exoribonuclease R
VSFKKISCKLCLSNNTFWFQGHFVKNLGDVGEKETETEVLLLEHDVPHEPFSQAVLSFLPKMPWSITEKVTSLKSVCTTL